MTSKTTITLYGNVGGDPETRTIPGKQVTKEVYDPIIDDTVEREFTTSEREVRTFSIAVSKKDSEGNDVTRWIRCDDWNNLSRLVRKGDRVKIKGHFRERTYQKDGETKTVHDFLVKDLKSRAPQDPGPSAVAGAPGSPPPGGGDPFFGAAVSSSGVGTDRPETQFACSLQARRPAAERSGLGGASTRRWIAVTCIWQFVMCGSTII